MSTQSLYHTFQRFRTLQTHRVSALPIVILMPHSACNCRCVMCDIWKDNKNLKQLTESDIEGLLSSLRKFGTRQVLMSGGEALLNPRFFDLCRILRKEQIKITLLSTGLTLKKNARDIIEYVNDVIVSLDGDASTHDAVRNITGAYAKLKEGVQYIKQLDPGFRVSVRTVIHRKNFRIWPAIIRSAKEFGVDNISFLPADVSSTAFNREEVWGVERQQDVALSIVELSEFRNMLDQLFKQHSGDFTSGFIVESPGKLEKMLQYYTAIHGLSDFPYKKCNAPWVSTVIEADGTVRPCFFHASIGNIRQNSLPDILNGEKALAFRKALDMDSNETCRRCVCYLHLAAHKTLA